MKKIKVAFCVRDMKIGGVESVMIRTMDALLKHKEIEIFVITYVKIKEQVYLDWFAEHPQVKVYTLYPSRWLGTNLSHFFLTRIFQHLCRDLYRWFKRTFIGFRGIKDIDVFVDFFNFSFYSELKKISKPKLTWWHYSIDAFVIGNYVKYMKNYDLLVALTDGFVSEFRRLYPEYSDKIMRIYNPIDINSAVQKSKEEKTPSGKYFCCVSRLYADKDIPTLLKAFDIFCNKSKRSDVNLYIIGNGSYKTRYEEQAMALPVSKQIVFTGALPNPFGYMRGAVANILSSKSEGLPTVLIEAAAVNTLNIASDCRNGPREILCDGAGGLLFAPGNAAQLAECMSIALNDKKRVKEMKKIAQENLARFDSNIFSKEIIKLIKLYA